MDRCDQVSIEPSFSNRFSKPYYGYAAWASLEQVQEAYLKRFKVIMKRWLKTGGAWLVELPEIENG